MQAGHILERQNAAGQGNQQNGSPQPLGNFFPKEQQGDQRGGNDFKISQQRGVGGRCTFQPQHQQNRCGKIQQDHAEGIGQVFACQFFLVAVAFWG